MKKPDTNISTAPINMAIKLEYYEYNERLRSIGIVSFLRNVLKAKELDDSKPDATFLELAEAKNEVEVCNALVRPPCSRFEMTVTPCTPQMKHKDILFSHLQFVCSKNAAVQSFLRPPIACFPADIEVTDDPTMDWYTLEMSVFVAWEDAHPAEQEPWTQSRNNRWSDHEVDCYAPDAFWARCYQTMSLKAQMLRQQRHCLFSLGLYGRKARLFRMDAAGMLMSEVIDLVENPWDFITFLRRFNEMSPVERGWYPNATPSTPAERDLLKGAVMDYLEQVKSRKVPMLEKLCDTLDTKWPVFRLDLGEDLARIGERCTLIIGRYYHANWQRHYYAYHTGEKRLLLYKDGWPSKCDCTCEYAEGEAIARLDALDVPHLPGVVYTTVRDAYQKPTWFRHSLTDRYAGWNEDGIEHKEHTQTVMELTYHMKYVENSKHLVQVVRDMLESESYLLG